MILAAGKGKRLKSARPKVLHPICGKPALWHVMQAALGAKPSKIVVVVGHGADDVRDAVASWGISPKPVFVEQETQLGTGHAVAAAEKAVGRSADVLVLGGDFDPLTADDVKTLVRTHRRTKSAATMATAEVDDPGGYGRVIRDGDRLVGIVEHADATPAQRAIHEVWLVATVFRREDLFRTLPAVGDDNRQREFYLNSVFPILLEKGESVVAITVDTGGVMGLNSRNGLAAVTRVVRERINAMHMADRRDPAGPRHDLHRCRRHDRRRDHDRPQHDDRGRDDDRQGMPDRPERADRRLDRSATARRSGSRSSRARR